jgi:hypothetical protein
MILMDIRIVKTVEEYRKQYTTVEGKSSEYFFFYIEGECFCSYA